MILFDLTKVGAVPGNMTKREFNAEIMQPAYLETGQFYRAKLLPDRFRPKGAKLLNYQKRTPAYAARKMRQKKHRLPLVWTGDSRAAALRIRDVRATSKSVKVKLHARKLNWRPKGGTIKMYDEVTRIAVSEGPVLAAKMERRVEIQLNRYNRKSKKKA